MSTEHDAVIMYVCMICMHGLGRSRPNKGRRASSSAAEERSRLSEFGGGSQKPKEERSGEPEEALKMGLWRVAALLLRVRGENASPGGMGKGKKKRKSRAE